MQIRKRDIAYLAGLLHDIGKFYQRADDNGVRRSKDLDQTVKNLEAMYCPESHKHVLWTAQFIVDNEPFFRGLTGEYYGEFFQAAVAHHKPSGPFERIIQKADHYSSGVDRSKDKASQDDADREKKWDDFKRVRMVSVFEALCRDNTDEPFKWRLPVTEIMLENDCFPSAESKSSGSDDYYKVWEKFAREFGGLKSENFRSVADTILSLLHKYSSSVPSSTVHLPDVSLYDHLKSVGAFAVCIADYLESLNHEDPYGLADHQPFLLIGADLSGIQSYLYDIISTDASKNLKGRSFYLNMLADNVLALLLKELNLYYGNVVYASGGGFYLIAPNTQDVKNKIEAFTVRISDSIFKSKGTALYLAIDYQEFGENELYSKEVSSVWRSLSEKLAVRKRQKYAARLVSDYKSYFEPLEAGGLSKRDVITGEELKDKEKYTNLDDDSEKPVSMPTYNQIQLGRQLRQDTQFWVTSFEPLKHWRDHQMFQAADLECYNYLVSGDDLKSQQTFLRASADDVRIQSVNNKEFLKEAPDGNNNVYQFTYYGGNDVPRKHNGEPKTFDQLAGDESGKLKRLGFLRMDVDNLGAVFITGMESDKRTFSRYSTISRSLDYFFRGYLNSMWRNNKDFRETTSIIYSGGDDLFIVGRWDTVIDFAAAIREEFRKFTCNNPKLTLSGGVTIVGDRFPIAKAADLAGDAEKKAKEHYYHKKEKNSFCLLGVPLNWDTEFSLTRELKEQLKKWVKDNNNNALLRKIMIFHEMKKAYQADPEGSNESWRWVAAYDLARIAERHKGDKNREFLDELKSGIFLEKNSTTEKHQFINDKHSFLDLLALAARWAELELRNIT